MTKSEIKESISALAKLIKENNDFIEWSIENVNFKYNLHSADAYSDLSADVGYLSAWRDFDGGKRYSTSLALHLDEQTLRPTYPVNVLVDGITRIFNNLSKI